MMNTVLEKLQEFTAMQKAIMFGLRPYRTIIL